MKEDAGVVVMKYSVLLRDLWNKFNSDFGNSSLLILNISSKHVYLYRLWAVRSPFCLNKGFVCSFI